MRAVLVPFIVLAIVSCSTTGSHVENWELGCSREVRFDPRTLNQTEQVHFVEITSMLARHGFRLVTDQESDTSLQLQFYLSTLNPWDFRSTIILLDRGTPIVSAESVNPGFGNLIDPGGNIRAIVGRSMKEFEDGLSRIEIVRNVLASECNRPRQPISGRPNNPAGIKPNNRDALPVASGTGFVVSRQGHVLTNHHVIDGCTTIRTTTEGQKHLLTIAAIDAMNDMAILKFPVPVSVVARFRGGGLSDQEMASWWLDFHYMDCWPPKLM